MANFDDLRNKARDAFGLLADVSVEAYKLAEERAKTMSRTARLKTDIARERSLIRRMHSELGFMYYELHKDSPEEAFVQNCEEITAALERIIASEQELEELRKNGDPDDEDFAGDNTTSPPPNDNDKPGDQ